MLESLCQVPFTFQQKLHLIKRHMLDLYIPILYLCSSLLVIYCFIWVIGYLCLSYVIPLSCLSNNPSFLISWICFYEDEGSVLLFPHLISLLFGIYWLYLESSLEQRIARLSVSCPFTRLFVLPYPYICSLL